DRRAHLQRVRRRRGRFDRYRVRRLRDQPEARVVGRGRIDLGRCSLPQDRNPVTRYLCLFLVAAAAAACQKPSTPPASTDAAPAAASAPATPPPPKPVPAELPDPIADVNGDTITRTEFENAIRALEARAGQPVPAEQRDQVLRDLLDDLVAYRLLRQEAVRRQLTVPDA